MPALVRKLRNASRPAPGSETYRLEWLQTHELNFFPKILQCSNFLHSLSCVPCERGHVFIIPINAVAFLKGLGHEINSSFWTKITSYRSKLVFELSICSLMRCCHFHFPRGLGENIREKYTLERHLLNFFACGPRCFLLIYWLISWFLLVQAPICFSKLSSKRLFKGRGEKVKFVCGLLYMFLLVHRNQLEYSWGHLKILLESVNCDFDEISKK